MRLGGMTAAIGPCVDPTREDVDLFPEVWEGAGWLLHTCSCDLPPTRTSFSSSIRALYAQVQNTMAGEEIYRASTFAPVNIAVIKSVYLSSGSW